jgi:hypothetical protein
LATCLWVRLRRRACAAAKKGGCDAPLPPPHCVCGLPTPRPGPDTPLTPHARTRTHTGTHVQTAEEVAIKLVRGRRAGGARASRRSAQSQGRSRPQWGVPPALGGAAPLARPAAPPTPRTPAVLGAGG